MKNKIKIYLVTYNRKEYLKRTLEQILAENSPIQNFDITILDNASTDGTSELIEEYCTKFHNLKHVRHSINMGGNANICRAFEMGASSGTEYIWVLCDDDNFDFSNWYEVEKEIENKTDIICVSNYIFPKEENRILPEYQATQLTFVPAGIYRTELINDNVLINMYDAISLMFPQSCITLNAIRENKKIKVLNIPIVHNGMLNNCASQNTEYTRGCDKKLILKRKKHTSWIVGYANVLSLLKDKKLINKYLEVPINSKEICIDFYRLCLYMYHSIFHGGIPYSLELFNLFSSKQKFLFFFYIPIVIRRYIIYFAKKDGVIYIKLFKKLKITLFKSKG